MIPPHEVIGDAIDDIYARLRANPEPQVMFDLLLEFVHGIHERNNTSEPTHVQILEGRIRESNGTLPVNEMAKSIGLSERQLQRKFKEEIGLSPKEFCSVVRFNHVYSHMQRTRKLDLDIALECGYFDESHMMKDLSYYLGKAPKRFASMIRPMVDRNIGH
ncbi:MAG: AraC family transcriptional regulator [Flavobacteriales bacterium]|nr:AraC family transcriptional regulator [Flavobacteriales bacterium]